MAFQNRGGWSFRRALAWAFVIGVALNVVLIGLHWQDEKAWFEVWPYRPGTTIGYVLGRAAALPLIVALAVAIQNIFARAFGKVQSN